MPNQKSYVVSIYPDSTPGEPMPDPAVGGEMLEAVGWNKSRYFESQEEALAEAKSMYGALVEVKPKVRMRVMVKVITKEPDWEIYIRDFIVEADG